MTITGTCHFVSLESAFRYYEDYHYPSTRSAVMRKLADREIHIGAPTVKGGERLTLIDDGLRYAIEREG